MTFDDHGMPSLTGAGIRPSLIDDVGGEEALGSLTTKPLPDQPWTCPRVPEDIRERAARSAQRLDACGDELFDLEHRTACRRLLTDVAAGDPAIFRRRSQNDTAAAAIAWLGRQSERRDRLAPQRPDRQNAAGLLRVTRNVSQRADPMLRAIEAPASGSPTVHLGSPSYLVSTKPQQIADLRQQWR